MLNSINLVRISIACPEQYDAFKGGVKVGYIRLRWGEFTVEVPDAGDREVLAATIGEEFQGMFSNDGDRAVFLAAAIRAIEISLISGE